MFADVSGYEYAEPNALDVLKLALDNINSIFLVVTYLSITRGKNYSYNTGFSQGGMIFLSLLAIYSTLYGLFHFISPFRLPFEFHRTWTLCFTSVAPILVGWGFRLRFRVQLPLAVGFVYGFIKPIAYATQISSSSFLVDDGEYLRRMEPTITLLLAFLKILWAVVCVRVLYSAHGGSENIVEKTKETTFRLLREGDGLRKSKIHRYIDLYLSRISDMVLVG